MLIIQESWWGKLCVCTRTAQKPRLSGPTAEAWAPPRFLCPGSSEPLSQATRLFSSSCLGALCSQSILQTSTRQGSLNCTPDPNNPLLKSPSTGAALPGGHVHSPSCDMALYNSTSLQVKAPSTTTPNSSSAKHHTLAHLYLRLLYKTLLSLAYIITFNSHFRTSSKVTFPGTSSDPAPCSRGHSASVSFRELSPGQAEGLHKAFSVAECMNGLLSFAKPDSEATKRPGFLFAIAAAAWEALVNKELS